MVEIIASIPSTFIVAAVSRRLISSEVGTAVAGNNFIEAIPGAARITRVTVKGSSLALAVTIAEMLIKRQNDTGRRKTKEEARTTNSEVVAPYATFIRITITSGNSIRANASIKEAAASSITSSAAAVETTIWLQLAIR